MENKNQIERMNLFMYVFQRCTFYKGIDYKHHPQFLYIFMYLLLYILMYRIKN